MAGRPDSRQGLEPFRNRCNLPLSGCPSAASCAPLVVFLQHLQKDLVAHRHRRTLSPSPCPDLDCRCHPTCCFISSAVASRGIHCNGMALVATQQHSKEQFMAMVSTTCPHSKAEAILSAFAQFIGKTKSCVLDAVSDGVAGNVIARIGLILLVNGECRRH
jgi:hypothetical protein